MPDFYDIASSGIFNGRVTCLNGCSTASFDPAGEQTIDPSGNAVLDNISGRYIHHGGTNGLGTWEH